MYEIYLTLMMFMASMLLLAVLTRLLEVVCKPKLRTSAISVKTNNRRCVVRVEKSR